MTNRDDAHVSDWAGLAPGLQSDSTANATDMAEPSDMAGPSDMAEPSDMAGPSDMTGPSDMAEPSDTAEPADGAGAATGLQADVDWAALRAAATDAMRHAYAPYSSFPVGAAAITDDGRVVSGCNVENASYGVTLCAECSLVSELHMTGGGRLVAFTCVDGSGATLMPCGRCRQLLFEHSAPGMVLETVSGFRTIDEVLPDAFGPRTLVAYAEGAEA